LELSAGEEEDDQEPAALETKALSNQEVSEQPMPLELFLSATTNALELESAASQDISLSNSDLLEEDSENERPLVLYILSDDAT